MVSVNWSSLCRNVLVSSSIFGNASAPVFIPESSWVGHVLGADEGVEFFGGDVAEIEGGFAEADVGLVGGFGDLGGLVVADFGGAGGDEHEGILDVVVDLFAIGFDAVDAVFDEAVAGVGKQFHGVQIIINHHRLEDVQLEIALG